ncbi:serine hydrolase [Aurantiacibacter spongiae]|uniref:beta-lactamase n=1 Tax=Aurantiacibacter spongiae TaxID=2488860 RepID=A0A3N5D9E4_9SPHN|nr:serine hydrolase [Aurantiacibacter spongiae]RPF71238.1 serine hydrolase [Aurantiacibacter spongiae]
MNIKRIGRFIAPLALLVAPFAGAPAQAQTGAQATGFEQSFDSAFGTELREPRDYSPDFQNQLELRIAQLAEGSEGRIGVAAVDLATGQTISILGDQRFPMASTSKIAIAATFMEGVEQGRWSLSSEFPLLWAVRSQPFSTRVAPVREGEYLSARRLIELMLTRSSNQATDALLKAIGGPSAVNDWAHRAGLSEFSLDRDIATLVRDDGEHDPATFIDERDSASPETMVQLLAGLYQGRWLSQASREFIIDTMERCRTGTRRIPAMMPGGVTVAHKTGSLNNTSSDIGILTSPDGRAIALAIYVTGQGSRLARERRIASIARGIYDGYAEAEARRYANAEHNVPAYTQ